MMVQMNIGFYMPDIQTISGYLPFARICVDNGKLTTRAAAPQSPFWVGPYRQQKKQGQS
jgi:hypothetical protein